MENKKISLAGVVIGVSILVVCFYPVNWGIFNRRLFEQLSGLSTAIFVLWVFGKSLIYMAKKIFK